MEIMVFFKLYFEIVTESTDITTCIFHIVCLMVVYWHHMQSTDLTYLLQLPTEVGLCSFSKCKCGKAIAKVTTVFLIRSFCPLFIVAPFFLPWTLAATNLFSISVILSRWQCYINEIIPYVTLKLAFFFTEFSTINLELHPSCCMY